MGRHSAPRASRRLPLLALPALASRGTRAQVAMHRNPRVALGAGAAIAAVALTACVTATSAAGTESASSGPKTPAVSGTLVAPASGVIADPQAVEAARDVLVQAQYVTSEGASGLAADKVEKIEQTSTQLSKALSTAGAPAAASGGSGGSATATADVDVLATPDPLIDRLDGAASRSLGRTALSIGDDTETGGATTQDDTTAADDTATGAADDSATAAAKDAKAAPDELAGSTVAPAEDAPTTQVSTLTDELTALLDDTATGAVEVVPGPTPEEVAAKKAAAERKKKAEEQAQLDEWAASTTAYGNGQIPASALCELSFAPGQMLRCDAAHQIEKLNKKYREAFGTDISVTDSYRSYGSQVAVKATRGYFAAAPGTSNHGWGQALDLGGGLQSYGSAQYQWMRDNAPDFGFENPEWARAGGSKNEPWHWEYGVQP